MRFCILGRIGKQRWGGRPPRRRVAPPCPTTSRVCGEVYLTLPYLLRLRMAFERALYSLESVRRYSRSLTASGGTLSQNCQRGPPALTDSVPAAPAKGRDAPPPSPRRGGQTPRRGRRARTRRARTARGRRRAAMRPVHSQRREETPFTAVWQCLGRRRRRCRQRRLSRKCLGSV